MTRLTLEQTAREAAPAGCLATFLDLSHRSFSDVSCLGNFKNLERLDLGHNCLVTLEGLSSCTNLKWLSVIENKLVSLKGVEVLSKLQVLNAGKNKLTRIDEVKSLTSLGALILNDNNISSICKLDPHHQLNTIVLSKNPVVTIGDALVNAKSMKKISMSHCQIESIGSSLAACVELKELRLAHNKITTIPSDLAKNIKMLNLDLGNNLIERVSDLKVLSELRYLRNLNLQGNPIAEKDGLAKKVMKTVPTVRIFNAKPIEASFQNENPRKGSMLNKDEDVPAHDPKDTKKKDKRKRTKEQVQSPEEPAAKDTPPDATIAAPAKSTLSDSSKRKKKEKVGMEHDKNSNPKSKDDKASLDDTDGKAKKEPKRKIMVNKEDNDAEGIDDTEVSFAELVFSKEGGRAEPILPEDKAQGTAPDGKFMGGLVIDHTKKRKKSRGMALDASDLKLLSSVPEVGLGGLSGWD